MKETYLSVGLIGPNDANRLAITRELVGPEIGVLRDYYLQFDMDDLIAQRHDAVILDLDDDVERALGILERLSKTRIATLIVYSAHPDSDMTLRALQAGANEFLTVPLAPGAMAGALGRAAARRPETARIEETVGQLLVFFGVKGGVGVTTITSNFALLLARESGKKTLLIDLDLPLGDIGINLGFSGQYSTVDALENSTRLDALFLSTLLHTYEDKLAVLAAPGRFTNVEIRSKAIDKLVAVARREFDFVVVDAGSRLNFIETDLFRMAESIYMVTQTGIPELRNANRLIGQFPTEGRPRLQIVINRFASSFQSFDEQTLAKALTRPPDWKVPNDYVTASRTQNTATPLALEDTPISTIIRKMARAACGLPEQGGGSENGEKKRGLFGIFR